MIPWAIFVRLNLDTDPMRGQGSQGWRSQSCRSSATRAWALAEPQFTAVAFSTACHQGLTKACLVHWSNALLMRTWSMKTIHDYNWLYYIMYISMHHDGWVLNPYPRYCNVTHFLGVGQHGNASELSTRVSTTRYQSMMWSASQRSSQIWSTSNFLTNEFIKIAKQSCSGI